MLILCCCSPLNSWALQQETEQAAIEQTSKKRKVIVNEAAREELHRYMGYEKLMPKYLSLPYDISMQTNVQGTFLDIGYLLFLFLPIILLLGLKNKGLRLGLMGLLLLLYIISTVTGYVAFKKRPIDNVTQLINEELDTIVFNQEPISYIKLKILVLANHLYQPINKVFETISGEGDTWTYPLVVGLFLLGGFIIHKRLEKSKEIERVLIILGYAYGFFWLILGAGIIWYGILLLPLCLLILGIGFFRKMPSMNFAKIPSSAKENFQPNSVSAKRNRTVSVRPSSVKRPSTVNRIKSNKLAYSFLTLSIFWIFIAFTARMANYSPIDEINSRGAINRASLLYGLGKADETKAMDLLYPNFNQVLATVNADTEAQVYRIGTFFHYFIKNNNQRVLADNQLANFSRLSEQFPDKIELVKAFKRSGYKYLLLDLNIASIDNTPDQSLTKKTDQLSQFLVGNPSIKFMATDRIMLDNNGRSAYTIFGTEIRHGGTFVAFEIL